MSAPDTLPWQAHMKVSARRLAAGLWGGLIPGAVIGGIGGRLAMLVLRLTSDDFVRGLETDDGFVIGEVTGDTFFLVLFTTALGALGGLLYLGIRGWIPTEFRAAALGILGAAVGGALIIRPDGIDFTLLEPLWLAVVMFVALPALYGVTMSLLVERFLSRAESSTASYGWVGVVLLLAPVLIAGPFGLIVIVVAAVLWNINRTVPLADFWNSGPVVWGGRIALLTILAVASTVLSSDVAEIL